MTDTGLLVKVEGFGNLHPGYVVQGLTGNGPGEGYAVRSFTEIRYGGAPQLTLASNVPPPLSVTLLTGDGQRPLFGPTNWIAATNGLAAIGETGFVKTVVRAQWAYTNETLPLAWVCPPAAPALSCEWSQLSPDTLVISADPSYLNRALALARLTIGGRAVVPRLVGPGIINVKVPRLDECVAGPETNLMVTVICGASTNRFSPRWAEAPLRSPPVLTKLEGIAPLFENFEARTGAAGKAGGVRMRVDDGDPLQGSFMTVFNSGIGQRLTGEFGPPIPLARYPVLRFRYRGGTMARISLSLQGAGIVRLSERSDTARSVRGSDGLILDDEWHTWQGIVSDAVTASPYGPSVLTVGPFKFASCESTDQTGKHTEWNVDDLVSGPAVARKEQLAMTPHYFDFEGITQVQVAVRSGPEDFQTLDASQRAALGWLSISNHQQSVPEIKDLGNGLSHIFIKARNLRGRESQVTDIPFLLHRAAPKATCVFEPATDPMGNGSQLTMSVITGGGPPLDIEVLKMRWNDTTIRITNTLGSTLVHTPDREKLTFNWPLIFRNQLNATAPGQSFNIVLADIRDGAGNAAPDIILPRRIDYASDHTPPTLLPTLYPTNVLWTTAWEADSESRLFFTPSDKTATKLVRTNGELPYLSAEVQSRTGGVVYAFTTPWMVQKHRYLAFRLRRPVMATNDTTRIDLVLGIKPATNIVVALTSNDKRNDGRLPFPKPVDWHPNVWESFTLDVAELLKDKLPPDAAKELSVQSLAFVTINGVTNVSLHVQSVFVLAPWGAGDRVVMDAYDESGIGGIDWEATQRTEQTALEPAALAVTSGMPEWVTMRARDKAGNLSTPLHLPVCGRKGAEAPKP